jgi:predicted dehydrogenase
MKKKSFQNKNNTVTLAIVGCGAITETFYLPALSHYPKILERLILVDSDPERAKKMAERFHVGKVSADYNEVISSVDGVIVAVPHHLHYRIAKDFLAQKVHVLCEKPLTETVSEAQELIQLSEANNVTLSVNLTRRLMPSSEKVKELLSAGAIGKVHSITYLDGSEFNWPTASGFYFNYKISQKGVLFDMGSHVLDLICWWLGGKPSVIKSENDSFGGCEAVASLALDYHGVSVTVKLSRLSKLPNTYVIAGERGSIEGMVYNGNYITVKSDKGSKTLKLSSDQSGMPGYALKLVDNFIDVILNGARPRIPAQEALASIELLTEAYGKKKQFSLPWYNLKADSYAHRS